jgi:hypothetical protein
MYLRRKCYSSLYDDLYNDYLYDKYFSDFDDYDYYDQREFAMTPAEMAKLLYREKRGLLGKKGAYADKLAQKQLAKLENIALDNSTINNPRKLSRLADSSIRIDSIDNKDYKLRRFYKDKLRDKNIVLDRYTKRFNNK